MLACWMAGKTIASILDAPHNSAPLPHPKKIRYLPLVHWWQQQKRFQAQSQEHHTSHDHAHAALRLASTCKWQILLHVQVRSSTTDHQLDTYLPASSKQTILSFSHVGRLRTSRSILVRGMPKVRRAAPQLRRLRGAGRHEPRGDGQGTVSFGQSIINDGTTQPM